MVVSLGFIVVLCFHCFFSKPCCTCCRLSKTFDWCARFRLAVSFLDVFVLNLLQVSCSVSCFFPFVFWVRFADVVVGFVFRAFDPSFVAVKFSSYCLGSIRYIFVQNPCVCWLSDLPFSWWNLSCKESINHDQHWNRCRPLKALVLLLLYLKVRMEKESVTWWASIPSWVRLRGGRQQRVCLSIAWKLGFRYCTKVFWALYKK